MNPLKSLTLALAALAFFATSSWAQDSSTTRIEPNNFYGATVTIEGGVRVFRPLPPTRRVIINPQGATPLALGINETRVYEQRYHESRSHNSHTYEDDRGRGPITHSNVGTGRY